MLDPNYLTEITKELEELFISLEIEILSDIARRISMNDYSITSTAQYQINQLKALGKTSEEINKIIAEKLKVALKQVDKIVSDSVYMSLDDDNTIFKQAFEEGVIPSFNYKASAFRELILKGVQATNGEIRNICKSTANSTQQAFTKATDYVYLSVKSGAFDMDTAIANAIKNLSKEGLSYIDYDSGVRRRLDTAIRNAVRTGVNQTTLKCQDKNFEEMGGNLVVTSSHAGARYEHAMWQGQIFWKKEKVGSYKNFESATGYGTGAGLGGWNCRHSYYPYFEGISANPFDPIDEEENAREYELTQTQRYNERMIRDWDRRRKVLDVAGIDSTQENIKYREWRARQKDLLDSNPQLKRNYAREKGYITREGAPKQSLQKLMKDQLNYLTENEKDIISKMSGALSQKINFSIGKGNDLMKYKEQMALIDSALAKGKIPYDVTTIRKTIPQFLLDKRKYSDQDMFDLKGLMLSNKIYTSTSLVNFDYPLRNVIINMKVPKGFGNALYIKDLAYDNFKHQEEVLFGRGLIYYIKNVEKKENLFIVTAEAIGYER